jgi:glycosyltransferase involved in cell wall biosynthesis
MRHRILHLIDTGGPGGAETVYHNIVTRLDTARWDRIAAVPLRDWLSSALEGAGVEPVVVSTEGSFDVQYVRRLVSLCRSGVSLIHAHLLTSAVYGAMAGLLTRVPLVCTFHGSVDVAGPGGLSAAKFRIIRSLGRAHVVFVSESLRRNFLTAFPLNAARTSVIPNGIDTARFRVERDTSLRAELGARDGDILIGGIGNIRPAKGYDVLLRAAALLCHRSQRYRFVVVGQEGGALSDELLELHRSLGLGDRVRFVGFRQDIPAVMRNLDLYVSSSTAEGFSLTTVEAMACGISVVATRSGGPEEIIEDGVTGVLVPTGSPEALARAMHDVLSNAGLRRRMTKAARAVAARRFNVDAMVRSYEALYERCLAQRGQRHGAEPAAAIRERVGT